MPEIVDLDICSLKRPFDDARAERVRWFVTTKDRILKKPRRTPAAFGSK